MTDRTHDYEIVRHRRDDYATWGRLFDGGGLQICVTLGPPLIVDENGKRIRNISDFQHGLYEAFLRKSHLHGGDSERDYDVWQLKDVPDADDVQSHIGNWPWDSRGCLLLGTASGRVRYKGPTVTEGRYPRMSGEYYDGVTASGIAYAKFMKDSLALCAREGRDRIWVRVTDRFEAPAGTFA